MSILQLLRLFYYNIFRKKKKMVDDLFSINELDFLLNMGLSLLAGGFLRGSERKSKGNPTVIGTNCFVKGWSMIFAPYLL
jgi:hypothetical protein